MVRPGSSRRPRLIRPVRSSSSHRRKVWTCACRKSGGLGKTGGGRADKATASPFACRGTATAGGARIPNKNYKRKVKGTMQQMTIILTDPSAKVTAELYASRNDIVNVTKVDDEID